MLDLGSGGGFDCFLAAKQVGDQGKVIGVDMTPEMLSKARLNASKGGFTNTELETMLKQSGFVDISIEPKDESKEFIKDWVPGANIDKYIVSAVIEAQKA